MITIVTVGHISDTFYFLRQDVWPDLRRHPGCSPQAGSWRKGCLRDCYQDRHGDGLWRDHLQGRGGLPESGQKNSKIHQSRLLRTNELYIHEKPKSKEPKNWNFLLFRVSTYITPLSISIFMCNRWQATYSYKNWKGIWIRHRRQLNRAFDFI